MSTSDRALFWFRRDLRAYDNTGLAAACREFSNVVPVFVFDENILKKLPDKDDRRITLIFEAISDLSEKIKKHGGELQVVFGKPEELIPKIANQLKVKKVFCNRDFEPYAKDRDAKVRKRLHQDNIGFSDFVDQVIFAERELLTGQGTPYRVFTPYKRAWLSSVDSLRLEEAKVKLSSLAKAKLTGIPQPKSVADLGFTVTQNIVIGGSTSAAASLREFLPKIESYKQNRDYPAISGTSLLSPHIRFGTISIRELARIASAGRSEGHQTWLSELIWRDFYQMILDQYPETLDRSFQPKYDALKWPGQNDHFKAWCEGRTGYPIIDAAMRCLVETGWMHNRLRMVVASFLTKDLLIDWRKGERFFARYLLDFDLAANVGGWQWAASTGCDAQPYFRVFNPASQSKRFDPEGEFIRTWCPELRDLKTTEIHAPAAKYPDLFAAESTAFYPQPIVNHDKQRLKAINLFKAL